MKRLILIALFVLQASLLLAQTTPYRIRLPDSTYTSILVGVTSDDTVSGAWSTTFKMHEYIVTESDMYKRYDDPGGGTTYSEVTGWGKTTGKFIAGWDVYDFFMNNTNSSNEVLSIGLGDTSVATATIKDLNVTEGKIGALAVSSGKLAADAVSASSKIATGAVETSDILNATILQEDVADSQISLAKMTTAAVNYVGSGGVVTNNPDDVTLENKGGSTLGIKESYLDTRGDILRVGTDYTYTTIAAAVTAATSGDIILVGDGTYSTNVTLKDGVHLIGEGDRTIITNKITTVGTNYIAGLTCEYLEIGAGDSVIVDNIKLTYDSGYYLNQSGGYLLIKNSETIWTNNTTPFTIASGTFYAKDCTFRGGKMSVSGESDVRLENVWLSVQTTTGGLCMDLQDSSKAYLDNVSIYTTNTSGEMVTATPGYSYFRCENKSEAYINNSYFQVEIQAYDSAKVYLNNYVAMWNGRIYSDASTTSEALIHARNFYIMMDNARTGGSHCIEIATGGDAIFDLANGTFEYMGDKGEAPMIGNLCAGGGTQIWDDVTFIDHGSVLNVGYVYNENMIYGITDATITNCKFIWKGTHDFNYFGALRLSPSNSSPLNTTIINSSVYCIPGHDYRYAIHLHENAIATTLNADDTVNVDLQCFGCELVNSGIAGDEQRFAEHNFAHYLKPKKSTEDSLEFYEKIHITNKSTTNTGLSVTLPLDVVLDDTLFSSERAMELSDIYELSGGNSFRQLNLTIPRVWFKGEGTITVHDSSVSDRYTDGFIEGHDNAELDLYGAPANGVHIYVKDPDGGWFYYQIDHGTTDFDEDTLDISHNTIADTTLANVEYYWHLGKSSTRSQWLNVGTVDTLFMTFDVGYSRASAPLFLDFLMMTGVEDGTEYESVYRIQVTNVYTSTQAIVTQIAVDTLVDSGTAHYMYDVSKIEAVNYGDANDKRYVKLRFCDIIDDYMKVGFSFITAIGVKNVKLSKYGTRF